MAKHRKKIDKKGETKEIFKLTSLQTPDYENEDDAPEVDEEGEERLKKIRVPKAVYRVAAILLALVLGLACWVNRDKLTLENITGWVKLQFVGASEGDGFPVSITGSSVAAGNFTAQNGNVLILSDTSLTALDSSARSLLSLRHSFSEPSIRTAGGKTLLYNQGSLGYLLLAGTQTIVDQSAPRDILVGAVAQNGRHALGTQGKDGASELDVYQKDGSLQFQYMFAKDYITAVALNYDGTMGAVCTVRTEKGELVSRVVIFDFNQPEPVSDFEVKGNYLLDIFWTEGGDLYAVGETAILLADSSRYEFTECSYDGRRLTAYHMGQGRAFLSVSAYEHAGPSTLLVFRGRSEPLRIEAQERIVSISSFGGTVAALADTNVLFFDDSTGTALGEAPAGSDAKGIALGSESLAFILGVSEVRTVQIQ